jgi:phosphoglucomutase/phosphomannomutase
MNTFSPDVQQRIQTWLSPPYDRATQETIQSWMQNDPKQLLDAFSSTLAFGTGGMRGLMGPGTTRMNIYTVRIATQGLANYIHKQLPGKERKAVFISYDSRRHSEIFAHEAAAVLAGNGIEARLTTEIRPTPFVSFGLRHEGCAAGIMITASHNPKEYNGYKVYWSDGGQVVHPHDQGIIKEVQAIADLSHVRMAAPSSPLITKVALTLDNDYLAAIHKVQLDPQENRRVGHALKITYTPIHGTGLKLVPRALKDWGFTNVHLVSAQSVPDGDFPTVKVPNPEYAETLRLGLDQMVQTQSDILLATDPDADRVAVATMHHGKPVILNGNEIASICVDYICQKLKEQNLMPSNGAVVTTIVSTDLVRAICKEHSVCCFEVLTGFKYIGDYIHRWEESKEYQFLFGAEESYGYLIGTHSRDKDAVVSACLLAEIALFLKVEGRTMIDYLYDLYKKYGLFREQQKTLEFPGDKEKMASIMKKLRAHPPKAIGGRAVLTLEDYLLGFNGLPPSDVLLFRLAGGGKLIVRPSGTEPKLKIYGGVRLPFSEGIEKADQLLNELLQAILHVMGD